MIMTAFLFFTLFASLLFGQDSFIELVQPFSTARIDLSNVPFIMELNLWNLKSYEGEARLVYKDGVVDFWCSIEEATLLNPSSWVWAYPEIYHGYKPWSGKKTDSPILHLPERLKSVPAFSVEIEYELSHDENLPMNFALESWFTRKQYPRSVSQGDAEVMIWIYHNNLKPAGEKVGEVPILMSINGVKVPTIWEIWYALMDWDYVAFRIKNPFAREECGYPFLNSSERRAKCFRDTPSAFRAWRNCIWKIWSWGVSLEVLTRQKHPSAGHSDGLCCSRVTPDSDYHQ